MSALAFSSSISSSRATSFCLGFSGSLMSSAARRPMMRSYSGSMISLPTPMSKTVMLAGRAAVFFAHDDVLRHVDQTPRQVAGVRRAQRRVGQTLARAVRRDEVFENGQAFFERRLDRNLEDAARRVGHQPAHAAELLDLRDRAARARGRHHEDRVERILRGLHRGRDVFRRFGPDLDRLVVLFVVGHEALIDEIVQLVDFVLRVFENLELRVGHDDVADRNGRSALRCITEAERLDRVEKLGRLGIAVAAIAVRDQPLERRLVDVEVPERLVPRTRETRR